MLDHVMLMNLERREDKWWWALGALGVLGFPYFGNNESWGDFIIRFLSHDGNAFPDVDSVKRAAVEDGFLYFNNMDAAGHKPTWVAWHWTWASALRQIRDMDKTVLLLIDDFLPIYGWNFRRFQRLISECHEAENAHGSFRAIQLHSEGKGQLKREKIQPHNSMLQCGFGGENENGSILNAAGAQLLLDVHAEPPYNLPHADFKIIAQRGSNDSHYFSGLWHTLDPIVHMPFLGWESDLK